MRKTLCSLIATSALAFAPAFAAEPASTPKSIPPTRPEMKQALDDLKHRQARLPLPPAGPNDKDERGRTLVNNGRMRSLYLPPEFARGGFSRDADPNATLDYAFTVEFFWIASRVNNCHYCLGHQENKLLDAGRSEQRIAALDCDWSTFTPAEQAAFAFARKLTYEPHRITDKDIESLAKHYRPQQIVEICLHVAGYNATNRWTDGMGIPQEGHRTFVSDTPAEYRDKPSAVAPEGVLDRGPLPARQETLAKLDDCRARKAILPLASEADTRLAFEIADGQPVPQWLRLAANFPIFAKGRVTIFQATQDKGHLPPQLKAEMNWVAARHDRAWYALDLARRQLTKLGLSDDQIFALDRPTEERDGGKQAALDLAAKLTAAPQAIVDDDIARLRKHYSDQEVAEIVHHVTQAAFFHRLTEPAQLPLEP